MEEKRPKRRKYDDNPYTLHIYDNKYSVDFKDVLKVKREVDISKAIYVDMDEAELKDKRYMGKVSVYIEQSDLTDEQLTHRAMIKPISIDETIIMSEEQKEVRKAVNSLPKKQRERVIKKFFYDMTFEEIAKEEKVTVRSVQYTLECAIKNLRKKLGNLNKF